MQLWRLAVPYVNYSCH